ncbi:MAG: hypothetical protein VKL59_11585 [Nostocaceae cyanobacterium]|nr:hypothetical protein [Nostocaceae cyanobacterium]
MISQTLLDIERSIRTLSLEEQLWLLERIARNVREKTYPTAAVFDLKDKSEELVAMANDAEIQAEIAAINEEFGILS